MPNAYNVVYASWFCKLDCVVNPALANVGKTSSGGTATDNTSAFNGQISLMAASTTGACKIILDGGMACTGVIMPAGSNFEIEGIGRNSGIWMISGSNSHAIYNNGKTAPFDQQTTPPTQSGSLTLKNFTINGNRGNGTTGNSTTGDPRGPGPGSYFYDNIDLANLSAVRILNMYVYDAPAYSIRLNNCADIVIEGNTIWNPNTTTSFNQDCVHLDGPWNDARIAFNELYNNASDDGIALNAHEGYSGSAFRSVVIGNTFVSTASGMRLYGGSTPISAPVFSTVFSSNTGTAKTAAIILGAGVTYSQDFAGQTTTLADNTFIVTNGPFVSVSGNPGDLRISNCVLNAPTTSNPFILGAFAGSTISNLTINGGGIYRNTSGSTTTTPLVSATASLTINRMTINDFQIVNEAGQSYAVVANLLAMTNITITQLHIAALNYNLITALADSYTNITSLTGNYQPESNIQSVSGAYTTLVQDRTVLANTTTAGFSVALPTKAYKGQKHTYKNTGTANTLTLTGTVDGSANPTLTTLAFMTILNDGTNWQKVG